MRQLALLTVLFLAPACRTEILEGASADLGTIHGPGPDLAVAHDLAHGSSCKTLDEASCKGAAACVADYCEECSCTPTFVGCRAEGDGKIPCPGLGCAQPFCCRDQSDCGMSALICMRPDDPHSGIQIDPPSVCSDRAQCTVGQACIGGHCDTDTSCPKLGCGPGLVCDLDDNAIAACVPLSCKSDVDCDRGFCVLGSCYRSLGTCGVPPP
jgi:hypothetical protein